MSDGELLDLVCGPASPLPETYQRYQLVAHLGSGGQAEVYRAVRLCGGVSSAPMTVKVFRVDPKRPLADELRSWDKGDAALMDLNNRGVQGICRRADGFYGPPPHRPGEPAPAGDAVPYQIYDYLHGINLRQYLAQRAGTNPAGQPLNAVATLRTLAGILRALHLPAEPGATPVLHMDIKPANLMVLTNGDVRLIDFTGARYWRAEEITQIAFTPESGGPEAFQGARSMGPAYDVHGFGAVAYYLITGASPRVDSTGSAPAGPDSVLRRHPLLETFPALRDHLHAPLADRPTERPSTAELPEWVNRLGDLVRRGRIPEVGLDWSEPEHAAEQSRAIGRATARPPLTGTETAAFERIERLERELVELRAVTIPPSPVPFPPGPAHAGRPFVASSPISRPISPPGQPVEASGWAAEGRSGSPMRGRARVPAPRPPQTLETAADPMLDAVPPQPWQPPRRADLATLRKGGKVTVIAALFAFISWGTWALSSGGNLATPLLTLVVVLAVATGVFALARVLGQLIWEQRMGRVRRSAAGAHAVTAMFLFAAGVAYLRQTSWVVDALTTINNFVN